VATPAAVHSPRKASQSVQSANRSVAAGSKPKEIQCEVLGVEDYARWDALVDASPHGTVFHYSWWLKAVAEHFDILAIVDSNGTILGGMPLPRLSRPGLDLIHSPPLTRYLGPIFDISGITGVCDLLYLTRTWGELLARGIASFDSFRCVAGAAAPDLQGFLWAGYRVDLAYTFRFPAGLPAERFGKGLTGLQMRTLSRAEQLGIEVRANASIDDLIAIRAKAFQRKNSNPARSSELLKRLWSAAKAHGQADIYVAQTRDGVPVAGLLVAADRRMTYQIISADGDAAEDSQGPFFVLWHAIRDALISGRGFDFEGSALPSAEAHYRLWGSSAVPIWRIEKSGTWRGTMLHCLMRRRDLAAVEHPVRTSLSS
jgi:hypothetical protein